MRLPSRTTVNVCALYQSKNARAHYQITQTTATPSLHLRNRSTASLIAAIFRYPSRPSSNTSILAKAYITLAYILLHTEHTNHLSLCITTYFTTTPSSSDNASRHRAALVGLARSPYNIAPQDNSKLYTTFASQEQNIIAHVNQL